MGLSNQEAVVRWNGSKDSRQSGELGTELEARGAGPSRGHLRGEMRRGTGGAAGCPRLEEDPAGPAAPGRAVSRG